MTNKQKRGNAIFYIAIFMETLFVLLDKSNYIIQHETWLFRITFFLFGIKILLTKYEKREWLGIFCLALLGIISWKVTDREEIARIATLVIACKDMDIKKVLKLIFYETLAGTLIIGGLAISGIYGEVYTTALYRGGGIEETRFSFGMGHPNSFHCMILMITGLFLAIYEDRLNWIGYLGAAVLNIATYKVTDSRTSLLIGVSIIGVAAILHYAKKLREGRIFYILTEILLATELILSILAASVSVLDSQFMWDLDMVFNGRMWWAYDEGGVRLWKLFSDVNYQEFFDMGLVRTFYWYGIIPGIILFGILALCIWKCREYKRYDCLIIFILFIMYSFMEAHGISVYIGRNYSFICMGVMLPQIINNIKTKKKDK